MENGFIDFMVKYPPVVWLYWDSIFDRKNKYDYEE